MTELVLAAVQCGLVALLAAWLTPGLIDNMCHPTANRDEVERVLRMESLATWPEVEAEVGHRRITDRRAVRLCFGAIVVAEAVATLLLWLGAAALLGRLLGLVGADAALALGLAASFAFTAVWAGFLIGGQWF